MFREMRRINQLLPEDETRAILKKSTSGTLALLGDDDYPYAVPLSYIYHDGKLYFHCAKTGHKIDAIQKHEKASFCVIEQDQVIPEKYTTYFRSVIAFGKVRLLDNPEEIKSIAFALGEKYRPNHPEDCQMEISTSMPALAIIEMTIEHLTGKEAKELMQTRKSS